MKVIIDRRFCGPKSSGNGGYAAGLFAAAVDGPASVTLRSPPPLGVPITLRKTVNGASALVGETEIAAITPTAVLVNPPPLPSDDDVAAAHDAFLDDAGGEHAIPFCFVCGNRRPADDGLRLFTGPAPGSPVNADFWTPAEEFSDTDGLIRTEILWAALDCPGAFSLRLWPRVALLGRIAVDIKRRPKAGERLVVAAWPEGSDGRKHHAASVLLDASRTIIAAANALWIELSADSPLLAQLKTDRA